MIYFAQAEGTDLIKIGFTAGPPAERVAVLQTGCPHKLILLAAVEGTEADERKWHNEFEPDWVSGEWFKLTPRLMVRMILAAAGERAALVERIGALERSLARVEDYLRSIGLTIEHEPGPEWGDSLLARIDPIVGFHIGTGTSRIVEGSENAPTLRLVTLRRFPCKHTLLAETWSTPSNIKRIVDALDQINPQWSHRITIDVEMPDGTTRRLAEASAEAIA